MLTPVSISGSILERCGFKEISGSKTKPDAMEYALHVPTSGYVKNEIYARLHQDDPDQTFAVARINGHHAGNHLVHLHQLQNVFYALACKEMEII